MANTKKTSRGGSHAEHVKAGKAGAEARWHGHAEHEHAEHKHEHGKKGQEHGHGKGAKADHGK